MRVWIIQQGEPLPIDPGMPRIMRSGLLAEELTKRGHEVVFWASAFDHRRKAFRSNRHALVDVSPKYRIQLLHGPSYHNHLGVRRIVNHRQIGIAFAKLAPSSPSPDILHVGFPTIRLAWEATRYARTLGVPSVVDIRDLWPDFMEECLPGRLRPLAKPFLRPLRKRAREAMRLASNLSGITESYVDWGARMAGRPRNGGDRFFQTAYPAAPVSAADLEAGARFWRDMGLHEGHSIVCFIGTMTRTFDHKTLINAARRLGDEDSSLRVVICGDGGSMREIREATGRLGNVVLPGFIDRPKIAALMNMSMAGLLPYHSFQAFLTNIPNKPGEYFSAGLPIISQLKGELAKLVAAYDCGVTVEAEPEAWVRAIMELKNDPARRRQMGENARALFEERFSAEKVYGDLADWLERLVEDARSKKDDARRR